MKVGDLVLAEAHIGDPRLGMVLKINNNPKPLDHIEAMFPYFICFNDVSFPDDWYRADDLKVISEGS